MTKIKILGLGNPLFSDEGFGIHVVKQLFDSDWPKTVEIIDGGTDGLATLAVVEAATHLLVLDAVHTNQPQGTLFKMGLAEVPAYSQNRLSPHQLGFQEVLALAKFRDAFPKHATLIGVVPVTLALGTELSQTIAGRIPEALALVREQINLWSA